MKGIKSMKINKRTSYDILNDSSIYANSWMHMNTPKQWRNSLPAKEMAEDFMNTFKDLLEVAKPLI